MIEILYLIFLAIRFLLFRVLFAFTFVTSALLAWGLLVKKKLNLSHNPIDVICDTCRSHFLRQITDAFEDLLDDLFVILLFHSMLEVRIENLVEELLDRLW